MHYLKTSLVLLFLVSFFGTSFGQTYTSEADFLAALGTTTPTMEDYELCATPGRTSGTTTALTHFTLEHSPNPSGSFGCRTGAGDCDHAGGVADFKFIDSVIITFNSPQNAFGTFYLDAANVTYSSSGVIVFDNGSTFTLFDNTGSPACNERFFGYVSNQSFTQVKILLPGRDPGNAAARDGVNLNNTYFALIQPAQTVPTLSEWGLILLVLFMLITSVLAIRQVALTSEF